MLSRRAATEILIGHQNRCSLEALLVERVISLRPFVLEGVGAEVFEGHRAQKAPRDDPVGIHIGAAYDDRSSIYLGSLAICCHRSSVVRVR